MSLLDRLFAGRASEIAVIKDERKFFGLHRHRITVLVAVKRGVKRLVLKESECMIPLVGATSYVELSGAQALKLHEAVATFLDEPYRT